jgi:hypothetical protein
MAFHETAPGDAICAVRRGVSVPGGVGSGQVAVVSEPVRAGVVGVHGATVGKAAGGGENPSTTIDGDAFGGLGGFLSLC